MSAGTHLASLWVIPARDRISNSVRGFTLLEMLVVIAIIAVLTAVVMGVGRYAVQAGKVSRAKAELASLATALDAYKRQYGDYPRIVSDQSVDDHSSSEQLYLALSGLRGPAGNALNPQQRILFEASRFTMADIHAPRSARENHFVDPWGNPYRYAYHPSSTWTAGAYVLATAGADEDIVLPFPDSGRIDAHYDAALRNNKPVNTDNLYVHRGE